VTQSGGLAYDRYEVNGRDEWLMRIGPAGTRPILFLPPLFEEMNRTRALIAAAMRALAARGFGCWLPDLPGTGESERAMEECGWSDWVAAARAAADRFDGKAVIAAIRGGCLLDDVQAPCRWRLAPAEGASLIRDLRRSALVGGGLLGGYPVSAALLESAEAARPAELTCVRTIRLEGDPAPADARLAGPALWRRSEPGASAELAEAIAEDIAGWARTCAVS
jgi:pimeloyl-ACP methyl ester carboxylesterase